MISALSKVSRFTLSADVAGTFEDYSVRISSNLDRVLQDAVGNLVREQAGKLEKELQAAITGKTGGALADLKKNYGGLEAVGGSLSGKQNQLNDLLKNTVRSGLPGKLKLPF
jgi:membrane peptidoglycan carboxypeptidase